jgi:hypothetical protein
MYTNSQLLDFVKALRANVDQKHSPIASMIAFELKMPRETIREMLRDVNDTLHGFKLMQLGQDVDLCKDCNKPLTTENRVTGPSFTDDKQIVEPNERVCFDCAIARTKQVQYRFEKPSEV